MFGRTDDDDDSTEIVTDGGTGGSSDDPDNRLLSISYDVIQALAVVLVVGALIFFITGTWPSFVVINGHSMQPNLNGGDITVVTATDRFGPDNASVQQSGIVTQSAAEESGYQSFNAPGDVIVFQSPSGDRIVHRALIHVEKGENWRGRLPTDATAGDNCNEMRFCPAPRSGFITKGDGNRYTDQVYGIPPVSAENVTGVARWKVSIFAELRQIIP